MMKLGLSIPSFTLPGGPSGLGGHLAEVAAAAESAGVDRISVMDHVWQIPLMGPPEREMLEAYTTLGFLAARTSRIKLMTLVTGAVQRSPGLLAKMVTTLDVLSGGRAWLGIGAGWYEEEARGLGLSFPPVTERFERLEETLQICLQMWSGDEGAYVGKHYRLDRTLNVPAPVTRPHPPILIGGNGESKTLRLVARYAQACNIMPTPGLSLSGKLDVLRQHCEQEGRDYDEIEKTVLVSFDVGADGEKTGGLVANLGRLAAMGYQVAYGFVPEARRLATLEILGREVIPAVAEL
jgi:F420-dependent oxidoreductase-like protein